MSDAHVAVLRVAQGEHERSQSKLFALECSREELTAAAQRDEELDQEDVQRTQRLLMCALQ